jgi:endonuclease/exonuclease/phosphatase family metal-dependent hydrolase
VYVAAVVVRVLTWNLMHGRAVPPAGHDLLDEFAVALGGWEWDVALLQEAPPWWPELLGKRLGAEYRVVLTSRTALLPLRRAVAERWPDVIKSNGGGANAILVRGDTIGEHRTRRLCRWPERRWVHGVRLERAGIWVANLHATVHNAPAAVQDGRLAAATALGWASRRPVILGGDFNVRSLTLDRYSYAGGHDVDHVFVRSLHAVDPGAETLERGRLSDHAPAAVSVTR